MEGPNPRWSESYEEVVSLLWRVVGIPPGTVMRGIHLRLGDTYCCVISSANLTQQYNGILLTEEETTGNQLLCNPQVDGHNKMIYWFSHANMLHLNSLINWQKVEETRMQMRRPSHPHV